MSEDWFKNFFCVPVMQIRPLDPHDCHRQAVPSLFVILLVHFHKPILY